MRRYLRTEYWMRMGPSAHTVSTAIVGLFVTLSVWYLTLTSEQRAFELEFAGRANNQHTILQNGIGDYWDRLYAVRALFESSGHVTREEFETFARSLLENHPAIMNISWLPRVKRDERAAHEREGARDGLPDYHIRAIAEDGSLPISPVRDEYFPKFYSTEDRNSPVYGLDNQDGAGREQALGRIRDGDTLASSPPVTLHIGNGDRRGFWAGIPVYAPGRPHGVRALLEDQDAHPAEALRGGGTVSRSSGPRCRPWPGTPGSYAAVAVSYRSAVPASPKNVAPSAVRSTSSEGNDWASRSRAASTAVPRFRRSKSVE